MFLSTSSQPSEMVLEGCILGTGDLYHLFVASGCGDWDIHLAFDQIPLNECQASLIQRGATRASLARCITCLFPLPVVAWYRGRI